jgi:hypothetical protein
VQVTRQAFAIKELDEDGVGGTVALVMSTLTDFLSDREKKSNNTTTLPSSSPPSDGDLQDLLSPFSVSTD